MAQATVPLPRATGFELKWPGFVTALVIVGVVAGVLGFVARDQQPPPVNPDQTIADQMVGMYQGTTGVALADQIYAPNIVLHDRIGDTEIRGLTAMKVDALSKIAVSFRLSNVTAPVRVGQVASWYMTYQLATDHAPMTFLVVVRFSGDKIAEQWVYPIS